METRSTAESRAFGIEARVVIVRGVVIGVEAELQIAVEKRRFDEGDGAVLIVGPDVQVDRNVLSAPQEVRFRQADVEADPVGDRIARAEVQRPGGLLVDVHVNDDLVGPGSGVGVHLRGGEEAKCADAFRGIAYFSRVQGIALDRAELAPNNLVQCRRVALDVDPLDENARPWSGRRPRPACLPFRCA